MSNQEQYSAPEGVAIVGLSGRFPKAKTTAEFWQNLVAGVEAVSFFTDDELRAEGVAEAVLSDPAYVKAKAVLDDIESFDAGFFGITPKEAEITDPQQRLFLECAWAALENAGYDSEQYGGAIGLFAGSSLNSYLMVNLFSNPGLVDSVGILQTSIPNRADHLTTRCAYKLNLKGPAVTVQTACSTSLVAVHLACQSLLNYQCDMALAGGATVSVPKRSGYFHQEGGVLSPDGHCRAFDHRANGTVVGNGVGVVVLKRVADALADGDEIHAVIRGTAVNNDGSLKLGYTAPSVEGQVEVIAMAQAVAGVGPETITYVEAHGTGTTLGDPMEMEALTAAFRSGTDRKNYCAVGSVKANIGHLDVAAGVAGLIKTTLALEARVLPPLANFERANPGINLEGSPFYFNPEAAPWESDGAPRRAGVSSFGIGGTNAHAVLEEAPPRAASGPSRPSQLLVLSAKTGAALEAATQNLSAHLRDNPQASLADIAHTLAVGRRAFRHRRVLVSADTGDAAQALEQLTPHRVVTGLQEPKERPVFFMFTGQGSQHPGMGRELYETEATFRAEVDACAEQLRPALGLDLRDVLYPPAGQEADAAERLRQTFLTQPALFVTEYALAKLWMEWGVRPAAMIGHSIGEYVAACLAGVMSLPDALALVAARGRLMQGAEPGEMLSVPLPEKEVLPLLGDELSLASVNAPGMCVVAGGAEAVGRLEEQLKGRDVACRRLQTSHAFHSHMMEPILDSFRAEVRRVRLGAPSIPYVSNLTGAWITAAEATDADYWVKHLRHTVRFGEGVARLFEEPDSILLEVGPGRTLMGIARWHPAKPAGQSVFTSLPHPDEGGSAVASVQNALGRLWLAGVSVSWGAYYARERRRRVPLPTYPFERQRFWIDAQQLSAVAGDAGQPLRKKENVADWFYLPVWKTSAAPPDPASAADRKRGALWLLFVDECGLGSRLARRLEAAGQEVMTVSAGAQFAEDGGRAFTVTPGRKEDFDALLKTLSARGKRPTDIVHMWNVTPEFDAVSARELAAETQRRGFYSLLALAQALGEAQEASEVELTIVTSDMHRVTGDEALCPEKATVLGPCRVVPQEYKHVKGRSVDLTLPRGGAALERLVELLAAELFSGSAEKVVAYRHNQRWTQGFEPHAIARPSRQGARLRQNGVYMITGGTGGMGLVLAEHLARTVQARLVLVGRSAFPARERWRRWLSTHDEQDAVGRKIRAVQKLESLGARVEVMSADVADRGQMKDVLAHVRERFGEVNGVIHAAGVAGGGMIQLKTPEKAAAILSPKVDGTRVLGELFDGAGLDFLLLCSSRSAVLGGFGQIDYCAANAYLDAFAPYFAAKNDTFAVSVNWDGWQEVGMLVDTAARFGARDAAAAAAGEETGHPLIERRTAASGAGATYVTRFGVAASWILEEHRIGGTAVLPGVTYLEMARAAFEHLSGGEAGPVELRDVFFITPMGVKDDEQRDVRIVLEKSGDGFKFNAASRAAGADAPWQDHAIGEIGRAPERPPRRHDLEEIIRRCNAREMLIGEDDERDPDLGPRWQNIKKVYLGSREMLVIFELGEEFESDLDKLKLHPSLLDRAAGTGMLYMELEGVYLPMSYKRLRFDQPLPRRIYAYIRETENNYSKRETITFDVSIMDERGEELVEIEEFSEKRINDLTEQVRALGDKSARAASSAEPPAPAAPARGFYEESIGEGIAPPEGVDVFTRILTGAPAAQVVVSTKDLAASIRRAESFMEEHVSAELEKLPVARTLHPRPDVQTPYVEPRSEVERMLAEVMQEALGVDRVGVNDNFFELGGDSVLSIQIIARVARAGWQITPQQIFQHQTIAELAAVAARTGGAQPAAAESAKAAQAADPTPAHPTFQIAELDKGQLDKLSQLLAEDDDEDEEDDEDGGGAVEKIVYEDVGGVATAAGLAATGGAPHASAGGRNGVGEIESALRQHPSVRDAAVVARDGDDGRDGHVAYVVLKDAGAGRRAAPATEFSLFYFSADNSNSGEDKYRLYLEGAKFADRNGFAAVWTPERHFHESGGLYPNPSVLSAALATATERVRLCAGSVVMPLHHSIRVAEEWSVIDNLSRGRVGLSFTAGWIPNDFAFFPERFANKREEMLRGIEEVRRLWRGQAIAARDGAGNSCELRILPRPIQPELPVWLTCSGDPQMFVKAGELGFNVLTALLSQSVEEVAAKIKLYREARARHGHDPEAGRVTLMMHTYVGDDAQEVLGRVRAPLTDYLKAHVGLIETMTQSLDIKVDIDKEQYLDHLVAFAFERYYQTASLIGTPEKCLPMVKRLGEIGVNEVACFIDFGVEVGDVLEGLTHLNALRELSEAEESAAAGADGGGGGADELLRELDALVRGKAGDASLVVVEELPLTPRGTVDYGALPHAPAARAAHTGAGTSHDRE